MRSLRQLSITESTTPSFYLDLLLSIGRNGQLHTSHWFWHFWDITFQYFKLHFGVRITDDGSVPKMRIWPILIINSSYECFILMAKGLSSKLLKQGYLFDHLNIIQQYEVSISRMINDFWPLTYGDLPTDQIFNKFHDLTTELDLHRIMSRFHGAFATGVEIQQGSFASAHLVASPIWDLRVLHLLRPDSSNLPCFIRLFNLILVFFCFLQFELRFLIRSSFSYRKIIIYISRNDLFYINISY